jgi:hypothetical protein
MIVGPTFFAGSGVTDPYYGDTILITNCEQADGSTTFIDTSPIGHTISKTGGISITGQFAVHDGVDDSLFLADSTQWDFGTDDFTIEIVADLASLPSLWTLMTNRSYDISAADTGFIILGNSSGLLQAVVWGVPAPAAVVIVNITTPTSTVTTGLHNFCFQRSGSDFTLALDGVSVGTATSSDAMGFNTNFDVQIGNDASASGRFFHGSMRTRVTRGVARYASFPYTPDPSPWPDPT